MYAYKVLVLILAEDSEIPICCANFGMDFVGVRSRLAPISSNVSSVITQRLQFRLSTAVEQVVACALAKQRARVRFPVGTSFLDLWARWRKRQGTSLRAGRPGFDPGCQRGGDFSTLLRVQTGPGVHSTTYKMSTGEFLRG